MRPLLLLTCFVAASAFGGGSTSSGSTFTIVEKDHVYMDGDTKLNGYLMYPEGADASANSNSGLLVMPYFMGAPALNDRALARKYAERGMVVFVADYYGKNYDDSNPDHIVTALTQDYQGLMDNRSTMRRLALLALKQLTALSFVDENKIAGIGFCAGGTFLSELARAGGKLKVVISLHGPNGAVDDFKTDAGYNIDHFATFFGRNDPMIPPALVDASIDWLDEATNKGAEKRFEVQIYGGAVHGFSNPMSATIEAVADQMMPGAARYDEHWSKTCLTRADGLFQEYGLLP